MLKAVGMPDNKISMHLQKNGTLQKKQEVKIYETSEKRLCVSVRSHIDILHDPECSFFCCHCTCHNFTDRNQFYRLILYQGVHLSE